MDRRKFMQSTLGTIGGLLGLGCVPKAEAKPKTEVKIGHWLLAITGDAKSRQWCNDHGLELKSEWDGGYFVREEAPGVDWVTVENLE